MPVDLDPDERRIPLDLTDLSSKTVGHIHSEFAVRQGYAIFNASAIESHLVELRRALRLAKAVFTTDNLDEKKTDRDAMMALDPEIREFEDKIMEEEIQLRLLDGVIGAYNKIQEGASREISRREGERTSRGD